MKVLMVSTDKKIFEPNSEVRSRVLNYASQIGELFIIVLGIQKDLEIKGRLKFFGLSRWQAFFWHPEERFDWITSQDPFETGLITRRLAKITRAKLELQIHTDIGSQYFQRESLKNRARYFLAKFLLPRADKIRVVSQRIKNYLIEKFKIESSKIEVRPIVVNTEKIKNTPITIDLHKKYPQFKKIILMASRLTREKNIGLAIEAMKQVVRQKPPTGLIIVGSGPKSEKLKVKSVKLGLQKSIIFENWVNQEVLVSYYKTCDLFLATSLYEGYGMTLVEAQAAGCKIVSTDVGVAREVGAIIVGNQAKKVADAILANLK